MKIGILTHFHKSTNYGGVLQAYALCKHLNDRGHSARQILYTHRATKVSDAPMTAKEIFAKVVSRMNKIVYKKQNQEIKAARENAFLAFRDMVPHTPFEYTKETIGNVTHEFDAFITGSDQVWNPFWYDSSYMLDFVGADKPKISYAASIGVGSLDSKQKQIFKTQLMDFRAVSVREKTAADILSPLIGKDVKMCVDPTLLLSAEEWDDVASERKIKERYVFLYFLGDDITARKLAEKFAKNKGLKVVMLSDLMGLYRKSDRKIRGKRIADASPSDFISLIKHAEYIFTDSFHACVFSLLYQKEFFAFQRGGSINMDWRIQNLTELFGCTERFCNKKQDKTVAHLLSIDAIAYGDERCTFIKERHDSVEYLRANFG